MGKQPETALPAQARRQRHPAPGGVKAGTARPAHALTSSTSYCICFYFPPVAASALHPHSTRTPTLQLSKQASTAEEQKFVLDAKLPQALLMPHIEALAQEGSDGEEWTAKDKKDKATGDEGEQGSAAGLAPTPTSKDAAGGAGAEEAADRSGGKRVLHTVDCELVTAKGIIPGTAQLFSNRLCFIPDLETAERQVAEVLLLTTAYYYYLDGGETGGRRPSTTYCVLSTTYYLLHTT